jgi:membrane protein
LDVSEVFIHIVNFVVSFAVITVLFAMIFKYLPDVRLPFRKVWVGAILTSFLFTLGKYGLAMYLGRASTTSSYGAAGSVIIILMWVYYASLILFLGAEFTQVYAKQTGTKVVPRRYAMRITAQEPKPRPSQREPVLQPASEFTAPGAVVRHRPWQFVSLMLLAGFAGGALLKFKSLRKAVRLYAALDKH